MEFIIKIKVYLPPRLFNDSRHIPFVFIRFFVIRICQYEMKRFRRMEGEYEKVLFCMGRNHGRKVAPLPSSRKFLAMIWSSTSYIRFRDIWCFARISFSMPRV